MGAIGAGLRDERAAMRCAAECQLGIKKTDYTAKAALRYNRGPTLWGRRL